jgi:hypothetical protein
VRPRSGTDVIPTIYTIDRQDGARRRSGRGTCEISCVWEAGCPQKQSGRGTYEISCVWEAGCHQKQSGRGTYEISCL